MDKGKLVFFSMLMLCLRLLLGLGEVVLWQADTLPDSKNSS